MSDTGTVIVKWDVSWQGPCIDLVQGSTLLESIPINGASRTVHFKAVMAGTYHVFVRGSFLHRVEVQGGKTTRLTLENHCITQHIGPSRRPRAKSR